MHHTRQTKLDYQIQAEKNLAEIKARHKCMKFEKVKILKGYAYKQIKEDQ